jgi:hypothetical protein
MTDTDEFEDFMDRIDIALDDYAGKPFQTLLNDIIERTDRKKFPPTVNQQFYIKLVARNHGVKMGKKVRDRIINRKAKANAQNHVYVEIKETTTRATGKLGKQARTYTRTVNVYERRRKDGSIYLQYRNTKTGAYIKKPKWVDDDK